MNWKHVKNFSDFTPKELYRILKLRQDVFIIEQDCIYDDIDGLDLESEHLLLRIKDKIAAYCRIVPPHLKFGTPSIGRIVVHPGFRGKGYGKEIVEKSLEILRVRDADVITIEAQEYLQHFYESLGFQKISDPYDVDGIPHIRMTFGFQSRHEKE